MVKCQVCSKEVQNYEFHITDSEDCRESLRLQFVEAYNELLKNFINNQNHPRIYFTDDLIGTKTRKLCTRYILNDPNHGLIENVYSELLEELSNGPEKIRLGVYRVVPMGFIDYYEDNPIGIVGLGIRSRKETI